MKTIFVGQINEETQKVYFVSQLVNSFRDEFKTNCYEFMNCCTESDVAASKAMDDYNRDIDSGCILVRKCKDCGVFFFINKSEADWFKDRDLKLPVRCPHCRKMRKQSKV